MSVCASLDTRQPNCTRPTQASVWFLKVCTEWGSLFCHPHPTHLRTLQLASSSPTIRVPICQLYGDTILHRSGQTPPQSSSVSVRGERVRLWGLSFFYTTYFTSLATRSPFSIYTPLTNVSHTLAKTYAVCRAYLEKLSKVIRLKALLTRRSNTYCVPGFCFETRTRDIKRNVSTVLSPKHSLWDNRAVCSTFYKSLSVLSPLNRLYLIPSRMGARSKGPNASVYWTKSQLVLTFTSWRQRKGLSALDSVTQTALGPLSGSILWVSDPVNLPWV